MKITGAMCVELLVGDSIYWEEALSVFTTTKHSGSLFALLMF